MDPSECCDFPLSGATYVDDDSYPVMGESAAELSTKLRATIAVVATAFRRHGMPLNFKEDKTEALVRLSGPGSRAVLAELAAAGQIDFAAGCLAEDSPAFAVRLARTYKHMGCKISVDLQPTAEVKSRTGQMYSAMRSLQRRVLSNPRLPQEVKVQLSTTLLHSRLLYNMGATPVLGRRQFATYAHAYVAPFRLAASMANTVLGQRWSDEAVLVQVARPSAQTVLVTLRVKLFIRMTLYAPRPLFMLIFALIDEPSSWAHAVVLDLLRIWHVSRDLHHLPSPVLCLRLWFQAVRRDRAGMRRILLKGAQSLNFKPPSLVPGLHDPTLLDLAPPAT